MLRTIWPHHRNSKEDIDLAHPRLQAAEPAVPHLPCTRLKYNMPVPRYGIELFYPMNYLQIRGKSPSENTGTPPLSVSVWRRDRHHHPDADPIYSNLISFVIINIDGKTMTPSASPALLQ